MQTTAQPVVAWAIGNSALENIRAREIDLIFSGLTAVNTPADPASNFNEHDDCTSIFND